MHLFVNSLAATAGGGLTYIRNIVPHLARQSDLKVTVALTPRLREEFASAANVDFLPIDVSPARRYWFEQLSLPGLIRKSGAGVVLSTGNFALRKSPVPQILLSRNSIYTSPDFYRDLRRRHEYRLLVDTCFRAFLAKKSISWADETVAPSQAFADELQRWTGAPVFGVHHGFDWEAFTCDSHPLSADVQAKLLSAEGSLKLLFVSHYNYYRNFETLIRALPILRDQMGPQSVKLLLTCELQPGKNPGSYRPESAARLVRELGISDMVVELGSVPYQQLYQLYARADVYVSPAYTETFAHPLVEAMASRMPVVVSDIAVHREICMDSALYFDRFNPEELSECIMQLARSPQLRECMAASGKIRSADFSWKKHVESILTLARKCVAS
jgi:glycosyltransferase involved in cell wall biosynthesis